MFQSIASIPGAKKCLDDIEQIEIERRETLEYFFVPVPAPTESGRSSFYLCNMVFQGGGVLGLAHVGFLAGLEHAGVRCAGVAGTSAGAIVATALACARRGRLYEPVANDLFNLIATMPMGSFIDGPPSIRRVVKHALNGYSVTKPSYWKGLLSGAFRILTKRGLNPGLTFEQWLADAYADLGIRDSRDLISDLKEIECQLRDHNVGFDKTRRHVRGAMLPAEVQRVQLLRVVATGLPAGLKLTFPDSLRLLDPKYELLSPATFVRASMAIPGFFEPKTLELDPSEWAKEVGDRLRGLVAPERINVIAGLSALQLVDGGLMSNVQVDAFETMQRPPSQQRPAPQTGADADDTRPVKTQFPTIVATLVKWRKEESRPRSAIGRLIDDLVGLGQAVRLQRDRDAWFRLTEDGNEDVKIVEIDASEFNWLDFTMSDARMQELFRSGLERSREFLEHIR